MNAKDTPPPSGTPSQPALVWLVDDSPLEREMAKRLLSEQYRVESYSDGPTMLEQLATGKRPDVLVLDWHMPDMSGLEICRFLRQTYDEASLPILVLTTTGGQDDLLEGLSAGANDFVNKAFDPAELRARVGTLARARTLHDSLKRTEQATRRAREAAEEANRAKDVFLATVSHELRTPLNSILGWARLLGEATLDQATLQRGIETIQRNAEIQVQLIEDILDTTRMISGKLHLEVTSLDFGDVIRAAFNAVKPTADAKHLKLELGIGEGAFRIRGDADRLQQAVSNLLTNAVKFTPEGGSVQVTLKSSAGELTLSISDSGKGIPDHFLPHVFDRFRQEDGAATRRYAGLGLGLALVRHIVAAHGGSAAASSPGEGSGATFTITLPKDNRPRSRTGDSDRPTPSPSAASHVMPVGQLSGIAILVVEDDEDARDLLVTVLTKQGAKVNEAGSCAEALTQLDQFLPQVLLSDIGLPGEDGYDLVRAVRARGYDAETLPAIALTAYARREDRRLALEAGFQTHVAKPVEPAELVAVVARMVAPRLG